MTSWLKIALFALIVWTLLQEIVASFSHIGSAALIGIGGLLLAYLVYPMVRLLRVRLSLGASIAIVYVVLLLLMGLAAWLLVPIILDELTRLLGDLPHLEARVRHVLDGSNVPFIQSAPPESRSMLTGLVGEAGRRLQETIRDAISNGSAAALSLVSLASLAIAVPATSIYMLLEARSARKFFLRSLPPAHRARADQVIGQIDTVLGGFIRGQVLVALTVALMVSAMLLALHVPYAILIGVWAGAMDMIPYLGAPAGAVPGVLIAFLSNGLLDAALVSAGFAAIFQLEGSLIAPKIVSHTVGVSPLAIIFAVIVGGEAFGFGGMLVAVPVAGVLRILIENIHPPHHDDAEAATRPEAVELVEVRRPDRPDRVEESRQGQQAQADVT